MILISGGCSFSADYFNWPVHLAEYLQATHHQMGWGSSGNTFISRRVIRKVTELLNEGADPNDMLVGIMWSGTDRFELYSEDPHVYNVLSIPRISTTGLCVWPKEDVLGKWVIMNSFFDNRLARDYYKTYYNETQGTMQTYEHILRTQWFLERHNIKYFMSNYTSEVFKETNVNNFQTDYLKNMIDWTKFLPIEGCYEWVRDYSNLPFVHKGDIHPSPEQHKLFTNQVIIPFLVKNNYLRV